MLLGTFLKASGLLLLTSSFGLSYLLGTIRLHRWVPETAGESKVTAQNDQTNGSINKSGEGSTRLSARKAKRSALFQAYSEMVWVMGKSSSLVSALLLLLS